MQFLRNWIRNIILVILLAHFIEMLLPDNELKKYVKVVIGFFIILVILSPIFELTEQEFTGLNLNLISFESPSFKEIVQKGKNLRRRQNKEVKGEYKDKLSRQIEAVTKLNSEIKEVKAKVSVDENNSLKRVVITGEREENISAETDSSEKAGQNKKTEEKLQDIIATLYGLEVNQVKIQLH